MVQTSNPDQFLLGDALGNTSGMAGCLFISPNKCKTVFIQNYKLSDARVKEH